MTAGGIAWMSTMSSFNIVVQSVVPDWVSCPALARNLLVLYAAMSCGVCFGSHRATSWSAANAFMRSYCSGS